MSRTDIFEVPGCLAVRVIGMNCNVVKEQEQRKRIWKEDLVNLKEGRANLNEHMI
jgi:hypothetical protein